MKEENQHILKLLIDDCKKGNRSSQKELYKQFYSYGMNVCLHYSKNKQEAQEIMNDGFLKVFKNIHQFEFKGAFKAWLRKILVRTALDYHKKHHKHSETLEIRYLQEPSIGNPAIDRLTLNRVLEIVQQLPPSYRTTYLLHVVEGYSHPEIAKNLGVSVGTSKSNLAKAKKKLNQLLKNYFPDQFKAV